MSRWQRLLVRARKVHQWTAALITLGFALPVGFNLYLQRLDAAESARAIASLRLEGVASSVARALEQMVTATAVLADGFDQGNPELLSRTSSNVLRLIGSSARLEIKPEGAQPILIAVDSAPPSEFTLPHSGLAEKWKAPMPIGDPVINVHFQQLLVTQALVNRSPEGRTRFWGYVVIGQPFSALAKTAQLNQLAAEAYAIKVRYQPPGSDEQALLFDTFSDGKDEIFHKTVQLPGNARLHFDIASTRPDTVWGSDILFLLVASGALYSLILFALKRPATLQQRIRIANKLLEDEKNSLQEEIAVRLEAEKMLERSHRLLDSIFEHIPGMIILKRASDLRIVRINRSGEEIFARSRHTLIGRSNDEIYEPSLADRLNHSDATVLAAQTSLELPAEQYVMPGQAPRWISVRKTVLAGEDGQPEYILEFGRDITEQEKLDLRLREHLHFLEQLVDAIPSPLFLKDTKGRYLSVNRAFERYMGISRETITGKTLFDIASPALARAYERADTDLLAEGGSQVYETLVRDADGSERDVMFHKAVFHQTDGNKGGIVGIVFDITERKQAEQHVSRLNRFLTALSNVNEAIVRTGDPDQLLAQVANLLCACGNFSISWIARSDSNTLLLSERCRDDEALVREVLAALPVEMGSLLTHPFYGRTENVLGIQLQDKLSGRKLHNIALLPIGCARIGILDREERALSEQEKQLLEDLANNVTQALERIEAESQKRKAAEQLELAARVFENSAEGIMITDANNRILLVNKTFSHVTLYDAAEVIGQNPRLLSSGRQGGAFYKAMWGSLHDTGEWHGEIENRRKNGELYPEWLNISVVRQPDGSISNYVAVFSDLTNRKEIENRIQFLSHFDTLTALPNRTHFHEQLERALVADSGRHAKLALITLDIDRFQLINDSLGHEAGDSILIEAATRLKSSLTPGDTLCRLGGDEFAIILNHIESNSDASAMAVICQTRLRKSIQINEHEIHLSASIGISVYPDDAQSVEGLIGCADSAMYAAVEAGGNTFRFFQTEMNARSAERMRIESLLHHALERGEFSVCFQPLVSARNGEIVGAEALLRWHNDELGAISPNIFVPLLEDTQLIRHVGKWVLRKSCLENKRWRKRSGQDMFVAVNLSAVQLADDNLVNDIRQILEDTGCDPRYVEIELTESAIMHDSELGIRTLNRLKDLGIRLSIDDFGTGYSSLSYLNSFPLDTLKIDRSFVMNAASDHNAQAIIKAIVAMGHTLGFEIIAEGVEDVEQVCLLREHRADILQGYYFSRPIPAIEFEELIVRTRAYPLPDTATRPTANQLIALSKHRH